MWNPKVRRSGSVAKAGNQVLTTTTKPKLVKVPLVRGRYDAAQTTIDNMRHWAMADGMSADAANSPGVRKVLCERARYEIANNSYAEGIVDTLANDVIGPTPRLQMLSPDEPGNKVVEQMFMDWAEEINLAEKLRTMHRAKVGDGEAFGMLVNNPRLESPVKLDLRLFECEQCTTRRPQMILDKLQVDGLVFDDYGNTIGYHILKTHPGSGRLLSFNSDVYAAKNIIHWFKVKRAGQHRGVSEFAPCVTLFGELRRYTLAVIAAAESAADFAAVLEATGPAADTEVTEVDPMDVIELEKRMATVLPQGWKLGQIKAEQPTTAYKEFKNEIINEMARALGVPFNVAALNSSSYNYASGRLDHQTYYKKQGVDRRDCKRIVLNPVFQAWINEAILISNHIPLSFRNKANQRRTWFFDGNEHTDPAKEARAQNQRLQNLSTTHAIEHAKQGRDWREVYEQAAIEKKLRDDLGLEMEDAKVREHTDAASD